MFAWICHFRNIHIFIAALPAHIIAIYAVEYFDFDQRCSNTKKINKSICRRLKRHASERNRISQVRIRLCNTTSSSEYLINEYLIKISTSTCRFVVISATSLSPQRRIVKLFDILMVTLSTCGTIECKQTTTKHIRIQSITHRICIGCNKFVEGQKKGINHLDYELQSLFRRWRRRPTD